MMHRLSLGVLLALGCQGGEPGSGAPKRPPPRVVATVASFDEMHGKLWMDTPEAVVAMKDGGFTMVGDSEKVDDSKPRDWDVWIVRADAAGENVWTKAVGTDAKGERGMAVVESPSGGVVVAAYTDGKGAGKDDTWVFELDATGELVWEKTFGGPDDDAPRDLVATPDGGYVIAGGSMTEAKKRDVALWKIDGKGELVWQVTHGGADMDFCDAVAPLPDGGFIVAGTTKSKGAGGEDAWLLRLDAKGALVWDRTYGGVEHDWFNDVIVLPDGGFVGAGVSSTTGRKGWLVWTDASGNLVREQTYGPEKGKQLVRAAARAADGSIAVVGWVNEGLREGWAMVVDAAGAKLAERRFDHMRRELADVIAVDGGWVMAGDWGSVNSNYANFWILKTDAKLVGGRE